MKTSRSLLWPTAITALACALPLRGEPPLAALPGQDAPLFSGQDEDGNTWKLSDHIGRRVVFLYFYPKDETPGCTAEACSLRDNITDLKQAGVDVVGVSFDDKETHKSFIFKYNLDFPLLADTNGFIADAYGARMGQQTRMSSSTISANEIKDWSGLINRWRRESDPLSAFLWKSLSTSDQSLLRAYEPSAPSSTPCQEVVVEALRKIMAGPSIYKKNRFKGVTLRAETAGLLKHKPTGSNLVYFNRLLIEDAYPTELSRRPRIDRRVSFLIGLDGKILHVTESPDPAVHVKELVAAMEMLRGKASP